MEKILPNQAGDSLQVPNNKRSKNISPDICADTTVIAQNAQTCNISAPNGSAASIVTLESRNNAGNESNTPPIGSFTQMRSFFSKK